MGLLIGTAVLSGCSEKQQANESLPTSSAAEKTQSRPELGPEDFRVPDEARVQDPAGAQAFVRYYFELINHTSATLEPDALRQLSEDCDDCARIADNAERSAQAGHRYDGGQITITEMAPALVRDGTADMAIRLNQSTLVVRDASGNPVAEGSSEEYVGLPGSVSLAWKPALDSWVMTYMTFG
ncbi:DUF6318 family protein [Blastococcus saxobsidens]|uniref:DUF6318 family protein n=1 Tax=Blastococcus saxobsidens TaxID=138336 RepID=UPI00102C2C89|nr:DUF6318 family protein [Blastococcus saxobsidens]